MTEREVRYMTAPNEGEQRAMMDCTIKARRIKELTPAAPYVIEDEEGHAAIEELADIYRRTGESKATPMKLLSALTGMANAGRELPLTVDMRSGGVKVAEVKIIEAA
jgi:hypothetical protein